MCCVMFVIVLISTLYVSNIGASSSAISAPFSVGGRSILQSIDDEAEKQDYAVELDANNFDAVLREASSTYAIVEFFAHWCPACTYFKPHYEKVAKLFNSADAAHPGIILMTRVDCALKAFGRATMATTFSRQRQKNPSPTWRRITESVVDDVATSRIRTEMFRR